LRPLAAGLAPHRMVVDCGDGGACGTNSLGRVLSHAQLHEGNGDDVRMRVVEHATMLVRERADWFPSELSVREMIEKSFATWAIPGRNVTRVGSAINWGPGTRHVMSAEKWLQHMAEPNAWIDQAFLALAADCYAVEIKYHVVTVTGAIRPPRVVRPRETVDVLAQVELAYVKYRHFAAVLPGPGMDVGGESERHSKVGLYAGVVPTHTQRRAVSRRQLRL
jgi:hypothetical protein